ncbi:NAD(P)H-quinone oxidoreductase [Alteromonas sp. a30]|nr:NAD(P)H-quinone oxidoreductase [Alteromonas sp. a30]
MRYIDYQQSSLNIKTQTLPTLSPQEVLVQVKAFGVNRADLLQKAGKYPPPADASPILGMEVSGEIIALGEKVSGWNLGDKVCAMIAGGGYATHVAIHAELLMPLPESMHFEQGAAFPEVFLTAFQVLDWIADLQPEQKVLIHAGASGVGLAAIQLAKQTGAQVAVTVSSEKKADKCRNLGADMTILYTQDDFYQTLKTKWHGVDVIMDMVAGEYTNKNLKLLNMDGKIIHLAMLGGRFVENFDNALLLGKRASVIGTTLRNRSHEYKARLVRHFTDKYLPLLAAGKLDTCIDTVFSVSDVAIAHERMANNDSCGKFVITW